MHVAEAKSKLGSRITWLCDSMENDLKHALGDAPNSEFIMDAKGQIVVARDWSKPDLLRADLAMLVGEVRPITTVADLGMKPLDAPKTAPKGVVPRLQLPGRLVPVKVTPIVRNTGRDEPFYVKLRAEMDPQVLRSGKGQLYLGFYLDPLYKVHWNNEAAPVRYEISAPAGVRVTPAEGMSPEVTVPADADPREFLVSVEGELREPIQLTVKYFACDDAETFCKPVTQHYEILLTQDRDGGYRRTNARGNSSGRPVNAGDGQLSPMEERAEMMMLKHPLYRALDADGDGQISAEELNAASQSILRLDRNRDGKVSPEELRPTPPRRG